MKILLTLFILLYTLNAQVHISSSTYKNLTNIQKLNEKKEYNKSLKIINKLLAKKLKKADKAYVLQSAGFTYIQKENYKKAIKYFEEMNSLKVMSQENYLSSIYNIAQLNMSLKNYTQTISYLELWAKLSEVQKTEVYIMLAQSYVAKNQHTLAIKNINKAINIQKINKKAIPLNWYELLFSNYYQHKDYKNSIKTLYKIIDLEAKNKKYWLYLSQIYTIKGEATKGLSVYEQAYTLKILDTKNTIQFVNFLFQNKLYFKGAQLLDKHINNKSIQANEKNLKLLFESYFIAKEYSKSLKTLNKLIELTQKNKYLLQKARLHNMLHQNETAITYYKLALQDKKSKHLVQIKKELDYLYQ